MGPPRRSAARLPQCATRGRVGPPRLGEPGDGHALAPAPAREQPLLVVVAKLDDEVFEGALRQPAEDLGGTGDEGIAVLVAVAPDRLRQQQRRRAQPCPLLGRVLHPHRGRAELPPRRIGARVARHLLQDPVGLGERRDLLLVRPARVRELGELAPSSTSCRSSWPSSGSRSSARPFAGITSGPWPSCCRGFGRPSAVEADAACLHLRTCGAERPCTALLSVPVPLFDQSARRASKSMRPPDTRAAICRIRAVRPAEAGSSGCRIACAVTSSSKLRGAWARLDGPADPSHARVRQGRSKAVSRDRPAQPPVRLM